MGCGLLLADLRRYRLDRDGPADEVPKVLESRMQGSDRGFDHHDEHEGGQCNFVRHEDADEREQSRASRKPAHVIAKGRRPLVAFPIDPCTASPVGPGWSPASNWA